MFPSGTFYHEANSSLDGLMVIFLGQYPCRSWNKRVAMGAVFGWLLLCFFGYFHSLGSLSFLLPSPLKQLVWVICPDPYSSQV